MKKIIEYFAGHPLVVTIITVVIFITGAVSLMGIKQDTFPDVTMDAIVVSAVYPGASAKDIETSTIIPIEDKIKKISGIDNYTSIAMENSGRVFIEIDRDVKDKKAVKDEIFRDLANVSELPAEVEDLDILEINPKLRAIYEIGVYITPIGIEKEIFKEQIISALKNTKEREFVESLFTKKKNAYYLSKEITPEEKERLTALFTSIGFEYPERSRKELYAYIDQLEKQLLKVKGVSEVRLSGYREREIKINVIPEKMNQYYMSLNDIVASIKKRNIRVPGGSLQSGGGEHSLVTIGEFIDPLDIKDVIVRSNYEQKQVTIKDIARVEDGFKKENIQVRVNNNKGVTISVVKKENADIVATSREIKNFLKNSAHTVPEGFVISEIEDDSKTITSLLSIVRTNAIIGFVLVFILLFVFLMDIRTSFWTAFGIPISLLITFTAMRFMDISINMISLGALAMLLGIIVDDSIVVSESIFKYRKKGLPPVEAAWLGVKDVAAPVLVSITTTMVAFFPLFLLEGMMGQFIFVLPLIVIIALLASLFESLFFLPAHLSHGRKKENNTRGDKKRDMEPGWFNVIAEGYAKLLKQVLKFRYLIILLFIGFFIFTIFYSKDTIGNFVLVNDDSADSFMIKCETEEGSSLDKTSAYVSEIEKIIQSQVTPGELHSLKTVVGHHNDNFRSEEGYHKNWAIIFVNLVPRAERDRNAAGIIRELRKEVNTTNLPGFTKLVIKENVMGPDAGKPVYIKLIGNNKKEVIRLGHTITGYLETIDGVVDIENNMENMEPEWNIEFDYPKMARLGINVETVAQAVRTAFEGSIATNIRFVDQELDFRVQIENGQGENKLSKDKEYLMNLLIPNKSGRLIPLKRFAFLTLEEAEFAINHEDGERVVAITADLGSEKLTSMQVTKMVRNKFEPLMEEYPGVILEFGGEASESRESLSGLGLAFLLAIGFIYLILVLLFNDLTEPLLIMLVIPFGIIGALLAFVMHGMPLSFMGIVGIIGLCGVVVNDCIVMVDFINKELKKGPKNFQQAIILGAKERLRPVILTTLTTVLGLFPTAYGIGGYSPLITPIAIALGYGLLFATLLTLIFIPSISCIRLDIITLFAKIKNMGRKPKQKMQLAEEEA